MLRVKREGDIALFVLDRPASRNALDEATLRALADAVRTNDARAVVITGNGAFCSGGDLSELRHRHRKEDAEALTDLGAEVLSTIESMPVPVFAAIDGVAFGGGAELALACDVRVAGDAARMSFKQARMGTTTSWGTAARLLRACGHGAASLLLLTAIEVDADRACALRLCDVRAKDARAASIDLAKSAAACGPNALREIKALLRSGGTREDERSAFIRTWSSPEHVAAIEGYFEKKERSSPS